jgi:MtrB/PioB family decaheme-associated outer membrane protein
MNFRYVVMLLVALLAAVPAFAGSAVVTGEIEAGLRFISGDDVEDDEGSAKFNEYDTRKDGLVGRFSLFAAKDRHYLNAEADRIGLEVTVGCFGNGRLSLYYNEFDHNYTYDAITPYVGIGNDNLTIAPGLVAGTDYRSANPSLANWQEFDYTVERRQMGAKGEITFGSPFFLTFDVSQTEKDGQMPWGVNSNSFTSPGSFFTELPMPVEYTTNTATATLGYRSKSLTASIDGILSSFDNDNEYLFFQPLSVATIAGDTDPASPIYLAPDNDMAQIGGQLILRDLPLSSTLALRGSYAKLTSDGDIRGYGDFDGEVTYTNASAILRSRPTAALETEIAYRYTDKDNDSDQIDTGVGENRLFHYTKHNASIEGGYHLTAHNRLGAGYEFTKIDRAEKVRHDAEETKDHLIFAEWKNSSLDFLTAKLRYEHLIRDTDFPGLPAAPTAGDYQRPFDAAEKDADTVRVMFDVSPFDGLDMGVEYKYEQSDYDDTVIGRTDEESQEVIVDANAALPANVNLYAYVAYEQVKTDVDQRRGSNDPLGSSALSNTNYSWTNEREDETWSYGAKLMIPLFDERLKLTASWDYEKNEGEDTFSFPAAAFPLAVDATRPIDIDDNYGDYTKNTVDLKAEYSVSENIDVIVGYLYEKYNLDDIQYNDYDYSYSSTSVANTSYLSGAYADPDYEAKVGYFSLRYKF